MKSRDGKPYKVLITKSGTYRQRFIDESGNVQGVTVRTKGELEMLQKAIRRRDDLERWFPVEPAFARSSYRSFTDLAEAYIEHGAGVREISESCLANYRTQLSFHILPVLGEIELKDLELKDIERLAGVLRKTKPKTKSYATVRRELFKDDAFLSASYRREILSLACAIAKFGYERNEFPTHPFKAFKLPDGGDKPYDYWRPEDEDKFFDWLEEGGPYRKPHASKLGQIYNRSWKVRNRDGLREVVMLALRTGMRKGEIKALAMDHVNFDDRIITVQASWGDRDKKCRQRTKNGSFRRIEMNPDVFEILWRYRESQPTEMIFKKIMSSHTVKNFSKVTQKAGVRELHFHALRHTFLTNIANGVRMDAPVDIVKVKELAGHSDIQTTLRYVHSVGIKDTSSMQWSREVRKEYAQKVVPIKRKEA